MVVVVIIFCVALNLGEMVAFAKNNLHPIFYLSCQVVKTAIWIGFSVFSIIGTVTLRNLWLVDGNSGQNIEEGLPSVGIAVPVITLSVLLSPSVPDPPLKCTLSLTRNPGTTGFCPFFH